jgi:hypothetical protein
MQFKNTKYLILRITEVGLAFCLVFVLSLIWSRLFVPFLDSAGKKAGVQFVASGFEK